MASAGAISLLTRPALLLCQAPSPRGAKLSTRSVRLPLPFPNSTRVPSPPTLRYLPVRRSAPGPSGLDPEWRQTGRRRGRPACAGRSAWASARSSATRWPHWSACSSGSWWSRAAPHPAERAQPGQVAPQRGRGRAHQPVRRPPVQVGRRPAVRRLWPRLLRDRHALRHPPGRHLTTAHHLTKRDRQLLWISGDRMITRRACRLPMQS
jgi:hypothetical protein